MTRKHLAVLIALALALPAMAVAAVPSAGKYRGKVVADSGKVSFSVSRDKRKLLKFTIDGVGATCPAGFQLVTVYVPSARISRTGRFSAKYKPLKGVDQTVELSGRFVTKTRATGTVKAGPLCVYKERWTARRR
ncbi:MAG: hypothetical protein M3M94_06085 [Actinomycetota bacterium]|nr:hypothetical protein [Actinomycetota bacterium]